MQLDSIFYLFSFTNVVNTYWLAEQALEHQKHFSLLLSSFALNYVHGHLGGRRYGQRDKLKKKRERDLGGIGS
jgi:hypothetical protein